jgi:hypothetical protein
MGASGLPITCGREGESLGRATAHDRGGTDQASKGISAAPAVAARALAEDSPELASHIGRWKFLATLGGAAAAWPLAALSRGR